MAIYHCICQAEQSSRAWDPVLEVSDASFHPFLHIAGLLNCLT